MRWGYISRLMSPPGYGSCAKCHTTWKFVEGHCTKYAEDAGMFPLCEECWAELTPTTRLPYYQDLWDTWCSTTHSLLGFHLPPWPDVKAAVMAGK